MMMYEFRVKLKKYEDQGPLVDFLFFMERIGNLQVLYGINSGVKDSSSGYYVITTLILRDL